MITGILVIKLKIQDADSLKAKRQILKSLKDKIKNSFNVSVAEVGQQDTWQLATVGIAAIGGDSKYVNGQLSKLVDFVNNFGYIEILDYNIEFI